MTRASGSIINVVKVGGNRDRLPRCNDKNQHHKWEKAAPAMLAIESLTSVTIRDDF